MVKKAKKNIAHMAHRPRAAIDAMSNWSFMDLLRNSWFLIVFIGTAIYWAARHDYSIGDVQKNGARITALETRVTTLESGISQLQLKLDIIKEDLSLIKSAVIK